MIVIAEKPPLDEALLVHYGVKGMHWGVRKKEDPAVKAARKAERKRYNTELGIVLDRRFSGMYSAISSEEYQKLSTEGKTWAAGHEFKRVVSKRNLNASDKYVSTNEQDTYNYRVGLGARFLGLGERHEITLKSVNKLSSPSPKERVDAFIDLMDKPSIQLRNGKFITGREVLKRTGYAKDAKKLDATQLGLKHYNEFLTNQFMKTPLNSAYFKEISKRGYNSLIDDNDAGILAKEPLILLNPSGDVKRMSIRPLSKQEVRDTEKYFKAP